MAVEPFFVDVLVGQVHPAADAHPAIHHADLPVVPVVEAGVDLPDAGELEELTRRHPGLGVQVAYLWRISGFGPFPGGCFFVAKNRVAVV